MEESELLYQEYLNEMLTADLDELIDTDFLTYDEFVKSINRKK